MTSKILMLLGLAWTPSFADAATWNLEIKNGQTSEVKTYKFSTPGTTALELPKFNHHGCMIEVKEPLTHDTIPTIKIQIASITCLNPLGGSTVKSVCANIPDESDRLKLTAFEIAEDGAKLKDNKTKKAGAFTSYLLSLRCE